MEPQYGYLAGNDETPSPLPYPPLFFSRGLSMNIETDKAAHLGLSYAGTDVLEKTAKLSPMWASLLMAAAGIAKEISDSKHPPNFFDPNDLAADGVGIALHSLVNNSKDFHVDNDGNNVRAYYQASF